MDKDLLDFIMNIDEDSIISKYSPKGQSSVREWIKLNDDMQDMKFIEAQALVIKEMSNDVDIGIMLLAPHIAGIMITSASNLDEALTNWDKFQLAIRKFIINLDKRANEVKDGKS